MGVYIPASGQISLSQVNQELQRSASNTLSMSDGWINVLSSGGYNMAAMHGKGWRGVGVGGSAFHQVFTPANAFTDLVVNTNGTMQGTGGAVTNYFLPTNTSIGAASYVYFQHLSGAGMSGTFNAWLSLGSSRTISLAQIGPGSASATVRVYFGWDAANTMTWGDWTFTAIVDF